MEIVRVNEDNFADALKIYTVSWKESHKRICSPSFMENRDYAGYLRQKMGALWMISDEIPVGVFSLNGDRFGDLYIHPDCQGRGYGTACVHFAKAQSKALHLTVLSNNQTAIALYEKTGFCFTDNDLPLREGLWEREMKYTEL